MSFNFSFIDKAKEMAKNATPRKVTLPLDESILNAILAKKLAELDGQIRELHLSFYEGGFKAKGKVIRSGVAANVEGDFILSKFEISPAQQVLVLRRIGDLVIEGENWWSKISVFVLEAIVCGLLRDSMVGKFIGNNDAVTVNDLEVAVDLGKLGIEGKLIEAVTKQWLAGNFMARAVLESLATKGSSALLSYVSITGARCTTSGIEFDVCIGTPK